MRLERVCMDNTETKVSPFATLGALLSCMGLFVGNVLGLAFSVLAVRQIQNSNGKLVGYRLALVGLLFGFMGAVAIPFIYPYVFLTPHDDAKFVTGLIFGISCVVILPVFMFIFAMQDHLAPPKNEQGYNFLGPRGQRITADKVMAAAGACAGLFFILKYFSIYWAQGFVLIAVSGVLLAGSRGARVTWVYYVCFLVIQYFVKTNFPISQ